MASSKYSFLGRFNPEDLYNSFLGLEEREQMMTLIGIGVALLLLLVVPVSCMSSHLSDYEDDYEKSEKKRQELVETINEYQSAKASLKDLKKKFTADSKGGDLAILIGSLAKEVGVEAPSFGQQKRLKSTDYYDEEGIEVRVPRVGLEKIKQLLHRIENHNRLPMKVKTLQLIPSRSRREELKAVFQVAFIKFLKGDEGE